jgi:DNA invertase Pin-like site-specific DNA recombinase
VANATHSVPTGKCPWRKEKAMNQVPAVPSNRITVLYCRVSTQDQVGGLESQIRTLKEFCEKNSITNYQLFTDHGISGAKISRPALDSMMALVRKGGVERVLVYSFSRFARSVTHLLSALEEFRAKDCSFTSYTENVDTNSPMGRAFFTVIAAISQLERELIQERVKNGLKNAKMKGVQIGRKKTRPSEMIRALLKKGLPYRTIASVCGTSHGSVGLEKRLMLQEEFEAKQAASQAKVNLLNAGDMFPEKKVELEVMATDVK